MIRILLLLPLMIISFNGLSHEPDEAYFNVLFKENTVQVEMELPWTIRAALLKDQPELETTKSQSKFDEGFFQYVQKNLILKNLTGKVLTLTDLQTLPNNGHSHQSNFLLTYEGKGVSVFTNTMMFNLNIKQKNHHKIHYQSKQWNYSTSFKFPSFSISDRERGNKQSVLWQYFIGVLLIGLIFLIFNKLQQK